MTPISQSFNDASFVQNPYGFYNRARSNGDLVYWTEYQMAAAVSHKAVDLVLRDRRFGRVPPTGFPPATADLQNFAKAEAFSLLNLEPPDHTRLRRPVLRAFTSRNVTGLAPQIAQLCHHLIDGFPDGPFDLISSYASQVPVIVIAQLLGVDPSRGADLLRWSHAIVAMYQPAPTQTDRDAADAACHAFSVFLNDQLEQRKAKPGDDLITALLEEEAAGQLTRDEVLSTCILLLNAGHEATVHALGNAVVRLLAQPSPLELTQSPQIAASVEECLRIDPPLHIFTRWAQTDLTLMGEDFKAGDQIACLLGAANRDPSVFPDPDQFLPDRPTGALTTFGAGLHFCLGAPLARLELQIALQVLFERLPNLHLAAAPQLADIYHFHGYETLMVAG